MLQKLTEPLTTADESNPSTEVTPVLEESSKSELLNPLPMVDYSKLFGEEFQLIDDHWDPRILNVLDVGAVEEGILHVLYACASQVNFQNMMTFKDCCTYYNDFFHLDLSI